MSPNEARNIGCIISTVSSSGTAPSAVLLGAGDDSLNASIFGLTAAFYFNQDSTIMAFDQPNLPGGKPDSTNLALAIILYDLGYNNYTVTGLGTSTCQVGTDAVCMFNLAKIVDQAVPIAAQTIYE